MSLPTLRRAHLQSHQEVGPTTSRITICKRRKMIRPCQPNKSRGGYTLMGVFVVIIIMITLVAITLPVAKKVMEEGHVREASRQLNTYFAMAKARAVQTGRPCGL